MEEILSNYEILKVAIIEMLNNSSNDMEEPLFARGNRIYSRKMLIEEIENNQKDGLKIVNNIILLAIDLVSRKKEKLNT